MKVRVGVVDSGINPDHPHVGGIAGGVNCHPDGDSTDFIDRIGHGTAVAGAIREKAPEAELYAVRIFERRLSANIETLLQGLEWCLDHQYAGPDAEAHGSLVGVSPHSGVGYRPWFRVSCTYAAGFFGLAILEELNLQGRIDPR